MDGLNIHGGGFQVKMDGLKPLNIHIHGI